jgi:hypothetical protein
MYAVERIITAYLSNEDSPDIRNPIHSTEIARKYGFESALVGGITVYGWAAEVVADFLGEDWLDYGWTEFNFKRPVYPGEVLAVRLVEDGQPGFAMTVEGEEGSVRIAGRAGLGLAPWFGDLAVPSSLMPAMPASIELRTLSPESPPVGEDLLPIRMAMDVQDARNYAIEKQHSSDTRFTGEHPRLHPAMVAGFEIFLIYEQFAPTTPGIHVYSQVQHMSRAEAGPGYVAGGKFIDSFERKGRHHGTIDGWLLRDGTEVCRARQGFIYAL